MASSAKALFGEQLDFDEYYRKFSHRDVNLPVKTQPMTEQFCRRLVKDYLSQEAFAKKGLFPYAKDDPYRTEDIVALCKAFSLNARQMHEFFRVAAHVLSSTVESGSQMLWGWHVGTFFMAALSIRNRSLYDRIGKSEISLSEFTTFLKELPLWNESESAALWWSGLLYVGAFGKRPEDRLEEEFVKLGVWDSAGKEEVAFRQQIGRMAQGFSKWGDMPDKPAFCKIYGTLEGLRPFAQQ